MRDRFWYGILALFSIIFIGIVPYQSICFADGYRENPPTQNIGNRSISLYFDSYPSLWSSNTMGSHVLFLRFFDSSNNETLTNVSFFLNVTRNGDQRSMYDLFYTKDGYLTIGFQPGGQKGQWKVLGDREPILGGWYSQTDNVTVVSPIFTEPGIHRIHVQMMGMGNHNEVFAEGMTPEFDNYVVVPDISNHSIIYRDSSYNVTTFSYFDKIDKFNFDSSKLQFSWLMPYDWNATKFQYPPFLLVHEDIHIPKTFVGFTTSPTYLTTVNGESIAPHNFIVDPYSSQNDTIYHIVLTKPEIERLSLAMKPDTNTMNFTLRPAILNVTTSSHIITDFGGWDIKLGWDPTLIVPVSQNNLTLTFVDKFTQQQVRSDINYDLKLFDSYGTTIFLKTNLTAKKGIDHQMLNLETSNGIFRLEVNVKSVVSNSGLQDTSRTGTARGYLVIPSTVTSEVKSTIVPEFPLTAVILLIGVMSMIVLTKKKL